MLLFLNPNTIQTPIFYQFTNKYFKFKFAGLCQNVVVQLLNTLQISSLSVSFLLVRNPLKHQIVLTLHHFFNADFKLSLCVKFRAGIHQIFEYLLLIFINDVIGIPVAEYVRVVDVEEARSSGRSVKRIGRQASISLFLAMFGIFAVIDLSLAHFVTIYQIHQHHVVD
ncbi:hypothetical protein BpHYR1_035328 [Brachionus plicatilis]|uniref:Uncharacterized protein n=1 Tax=Brachionus plicatilis TaxID=10195 RepID=A0A3M7PMN7_BRAPC|nr:hypothetical protein BpHYR1_035328 [Brachionus plicatilis]